MGAILIPAQRLAAFLVLSLTAGLAAMLVVSALAQVLPF